MLARFKSSDCQPTLFNGGGGGGGGGRRS